MNFYKRKILMLAGIYLNNLYPSEYKRCELNQDTIYCDPLLQRCGNDDFKKKNLYDTLHKSVNPHIKNHFLTLIQSPSFIEILNIIHENIHGILLDQQVLEEVKDFVKKSGNHYKEKIKWNKNDIIKILQEKKISFKITEAVASRLGLNKNLKILLNTITTYVDTHWIILKNLLQKHYNPLKIESDIESKKNMRALFLEYILCSWDDFNFFLNDCELIKFLINLRMDGLGDDSYLESMDDMIKIFEDFKKKSYKNFSYISYDIQEISHIIYLMKNAVLGNPIEVDRFYWVFKPTVHHIKYNPYVFSSQKLFEKINIFILKCIQQPCLLEKLWNFHTDLFCKIYNVQKNKNVDQKNRKIDFMFKVFERFDIAVANDSLKKQKKYFILNPQVEWYASQHDPFTDHFLGILEDIQNFILNHWIHLKEDKELNQECIRALIVEHLFGSW